MKFVGLLGRIFNDPESRGIRGENEIAVRLKEFDMRQYKGNILRNVYIPIDGKTTEIDLLYITVKGIFVMESKNYSGYIFGSEWNNEWTATYYEGKTWFGQNKVEKVHFYNPVKQNRTHISALRRYLKTTAPIYSIISFTDECKIKSIELESSAVYICYHSGLKEVVKSIWNQTADVLSIEEVETITKKLEKLGNQSIEAKQLHVENIKRKTQVIDGKCPWCGGNLVLRTAKTGAYKENQFWGCSNYPNCRFIKNIE